MSFKQNHTINLGNYEEYFILYMDNELNAEQKLMVENFIAQYPNLAEELDNLMGLKLPVDNVSFSGKEELLSTSMKANVVDEWLLLYIDNELPAAERKAVEQKISSDKEYASQHFILMQTKLDASEKVIHPNKKELYRHTERVVAFKIWMRVAAAVILLLLGSLFFLTNRNEKLPVDDGVVIKPVINSTPNIKQEKQTNPIEQIIEQQAPLQKETQFVKTSPIKKSIAPIIKNSTLDDNNKNQPVYNNDNIAYQPEKKEVVVIDANRLNVPIVAEPIVNKTIRRTSVTNQPETSYNNKNNPIVNPEADWAVENKKTPAKGFFRKVSRFIERNTGIGTVNADNELLIGAVALKLK